MNVKTIIKPQKSQFLRLTYFLTANFRDFEVCILQRMGWIKTLVVSCYNEEKATSIFYETVERIRP